MSKATKTLTDEEEAGKPRSVKWETESVWRVLEVPFFKLCRLERSVSTLLKIYLL